MASKMCHFVEYAFNKRHKMSQNGLRPLDYTKRFQRNTSISNVLYVDKMVLTYKIISLLPPPVLYGRDNYRLYNVRRFHKLSFF
jgi:hypothetical protein